MLPSLFFFFTMKYIFSLNFNLSSNTSIYRSGQCQRLCLEWLLVCFYCITNWYSPFLVGILQIRGREAEFKFSDIFGVIDTSRKHLRQVGCESGQALGQMSIKTLVERDKIGFITKTQFLNTCSMQRESQYKSCISLGWLILPQLKVNLWHRQF